MNRIKRLVVEAHRRSLWQVLSIYLVTSWIGYQVISELTDRIGLPEWVPGFAIVLFVIGLPIVLATAFIQEGGPRQSYRYIDPDLLLDPTLRSEARTHERLFTWKKAIIGGVVAFVLLAITAGGYMGLRNAGIGPFGSLLAKGALDERERIVIAEFNDLTGDTMLAQAVTQAFRVSFAQSDVITVVEPAHVRSVLTRMQRPATLRIDAELAREVAIRDNIKAYVTGEIARIGGRYTLIGKLVSATDANVLATYQQEAADSAQILPAVDKLSRKLREKIGESLRNVRNDQPLAAVTTSSLEALRKYTQAEYALEAAIDMERGIALLKEAVTLDTAFAMAWRKLAVTYSNMGAPYDRIMEAATRAYNHRDRLPDVERNLTAAYYHSNVTEDVEQARQAYLNVLEIQPHNYIALNNISTLYLELRDHARARESLQKLMSVDSSRANPYINLADALVGLNKLDSAALAIETMGRRFGKSAPYYIRTADLAAARHEYDKIEGMLEQGIGRSAPPSFRRARHYLASAAAVAQGRFMDGERGLMEAARIEQETGSNPAGYLWAAMALAEGEARVRQDPERGLRRIAAGLERVPFEQLPVPSRPYTRLATAYAVVGQPQRARVLLEAQRSLPREVRGDDRDRVSRAEGWIALAEKRYADAISHFRSATTFGSCVRCEHFELALAFEAAQQPDSAIAHYEYWLNTPQGDEALAEDALRIGPAYERLAELYERKGERQKAAFYAAKFVDLWKNADPELQPRVQSMRALLQRVASDR